jgi:transposase
VILARMIEEAEEVSTDKLVDTNGLARKRNKRWPEVMKRQIVAETPQPGASVSVVARRHDVNANQVFKWCKQYEDAIKPTGEAGLVPVRLRPAAALAAEVGTIEIELRGGARVRVSGAVDGTALRQVLEQLK